MMVFIVVTLGLVANWLVGRMTQSVAHFRQELLDDRERFNAEMREGLKQMEGQYRALATQMTQTSRNVMKRGEISVRNWKNMENQYFKMSVSILGLRKRNDWSRTMEFF